MLIKIIFNYIIGYIRVSIEGYYIERFINICRNNKITIWNLKRNKNVRLELNIATRDLRKIAKIAKQTKCKMKILNKKGLPFLFNKYKKDFSFKQNLIEKQRIFKEKCMNDESFKELTEREQTELYTKLISIV